MFTLVLQIPVSKEANQIQSTSTQKTNMTSTFLHFTAIILCLSLFCICPAEGFYSSSPVVSRKPSPLQQTAASTRETTSTPLWTLEELEEYSEEIAGVIISFTTLGPGYRAVARAKHDESLILGYVEGFVRPAGQILHLDKMEVFKPIVEKAKKQAPDSFDFGGISFGVGLLMGYRCLLHGTSFDAKDGLYLGLYYLTFLKIP